MKENNIPVAQNTDQTRVQSPLHPSFKSIYNDLPLEMRDKVVVDVDTHMTGVSIDNDGTVKIDTIESKISVSPCL